MEIYRHSQKFPKEETYGLSQQMRRSAVSIPSNIAEGYGRSFSKEYRHFLSIAYGSLCELETQYRISVDLGCGGNKIDE
jgi:four helix bundle protein